MTFRDHSNVKDTHAFLGASKYHWLNYDDEKMIQTYRNFTAAKRGTELHAFAAQCIKLKQRLPKSKKTLNSYVNDAIGYRMIPEQILYFSDNCYGTADAISFRDNMLRIHDLKTGQAPASVKQLEIYAALFCLEYAQKPSDLLIELRIYQNDEVETFRPESEIIHDVMDKIISFDRLINKLKLEEE